MTDDHLTARKLYEIKSISQTESPLGADGSDWHKYEIAHGTNTICGYKQGTLDEVTAEIEENVLLLNERQFGKRAVAPKKKVVDKAEDKPEVGNDKKVNS